MIQPPLTGKRMCMLRSGFAVMLASSGHSAAEIATVLNLKTKAGHPAKEQARRYAAKGRRQIARIRFLWEGGGV